MSPDIAAGGWLRASRRKSESQKLQEAIAEEILSNASQMEDGTWVFGRTITAYVSVEAKARLGNVESEAVQQIINLVRHRAKELGRKLSESRIGLNLNADLGLQGNEIRVTQVDLAPTVPVQPAPSPLSRERRSEAPIAPRPGRAPKPSKPALSEADGWTASRQSTLMRPTQMGVTVTHPRARLARQGTAIEWLLESGSLAVVGSDAALATILVKEDGVAREHLRLEVARSNHGVVQGVWVELADPTQRVYIDGVQVGRQYMLAPIGSTITLGPSINLQVLDEFGSR